MSREEAIARAEIEAAHAAMRVALLKQTSSERGCSLSDCPGPGFHPRGGCPMGYSGSCHRTRT